VRQYGRSYGHVASGGMGLKIIPGLSTGPLRYR